MRDAIGRDWQCGTTQVDFNLPERFGAFYVDADGQKKMPVMVHRAICGSMERFLGILIEHFAGHFPLWLAPDPGGGHHHRLGRRRLCRARWPRDLTRAGLRVETDLRNEKINYKVREHSVAKVPVILVAGKREMEEGTLNVRRLGSQAQQSLNLHEVTRQLTEEATPPDVKRETTAA